MEKQIRHPEQRPGEIYLVNANLLSFPTIGWSTKRIGSVEYQKNGKSLLAKYRPVFVQYAEVLQEGLVAITNPCTIVRNTNKARKILPLWNKVLANVKTSRAQREVSGFKSWSQACTPK